MNDIYNNPGRIKLNIQMIADDLDDLQWEYKLNAQDTTPKFKSFKLFSGNTEELKSDVIYILKKGDASKFPVDEFAYVTPDNVKGKAPHIRCINKSDDQIINAILSIFERYHQFEADINYIVANDGTLEDLCKAGTAFFKNPMYIHDNMFTVIALPRYVEGMIKFEKSHNGQTTHIPLWLINDFKFDEAYKETLNKHHAALWGNDQYPRTMRSLYVNIWDGNAYLGRLLINELESSLKAGQFILAEIFGEYIKIIMHRDMHRLNKNYRDYEDTIRTILRGDKPNKTDLKDFLEIQSWNANDDYLCVKFMSQNPDILIKSDSALRSQLNNLFTGCFYFFHEQRLCLIINLSQSKLSPGDVKTQIASIVRDCFMYCGISNPTSGIMNIISAFLQTDYIISYIQQDSTMWLRSFDECALSFMTDRIAKAIPPTSFAVPELVRLKQFDEEKGTDYYKTLRTYLKYERSIPRTSQELIIHRTTLQYRLDKIEELTGLDLDKEKLRIYLLVSFIILDGESL